MQISHLREKCPGAERSGGQSSVRQSRRPGEAMPLSFQCLRQNARPLSNGTRSPVRGLELSAETEPSEVGSKMVLRSYDILHAAIKTFGTLCLR